MKLKPIIITLVSIIAMFLVPFLTINNVFANDAIGIYFLLLSLLNPIVSLAIGIASGWSGKFEWYLPVINSIIYIISETIIASFSIETLVISVIYLAIGLIAALITSVIRKKIKNA